MLSIENHIEEGNEYLEYDLNYPKIIDEQKSIYLSTINKINQVIYEDVMIFKETIEIEESIQAYSQYDINLNKNKIISITMEFVQIEDNYEISYINTYNYDIDKDKQIKLNDIFKDDTSYLYKIEEEIKSKVNDDLDNLEINEYQNFYIQSDKIVICFSSYELGFKYLKPQEFEIKFDDYKEYLTDYTINNIIEVV